MQGAADMKTRGLRAATARPEGHEARRCGALADHNAARRRHGTGRDATRRDATMAVDAALHAANLSTLLVCMVLKFPQMFALLRAKSTEGVSVSSLLLELLGFIVFITYQVYYEYPPPTYLEYPILIAQDAALLLLMLHYSGNLKQSFLYAAVFIGGWRLLTVQKWIIDLAMSLCTFISAGSKMMQLRCLWRSKNAGQVSALTWALATYTCLARIYTTVVTTGDFQVLVRFIVMTMLNGWVTATVLYYSHRRIKTD